MFRFSIRDWPNAVVTLSACVLLVHSARSPTQQPPPAGAATESQDQIPVETFHAPRPKNIAPPSCFGGDAPASRIKPSEGNDACDEMLHGFEGWVELGFMVDPSGKPIEITVVRSTGDKAFDMAAVKVIALSTFFPGSLDGKPVESGLEMKYTFMADAGGPSSKFIAGYKTLLGAINAGDKADAEAALAHLKITNLSEDAYFGLATFLYASKWGDESQQLEALRRAIVEEDRVTYLSKDQLKSALLTRLKLEMKAHLYAEALTTWKGMEKVGVDETTKTHFQQTVDQLQQLRSDNSPYAVSGLLTSTGNWHLHLFKRRFQAVVSDGYISQVKLRCEKRYVFFTFDPSLQYNVDAKYGDCAIELLGAPGTHFQLVQS